MIRWAEQISKAGSIAYIETEYFGGIGGQCAVVWNQGEVAAGPFRESNYPANGESVYTPPSDGAISQALRYLGVSVGDEFDEFDALGLGNFRRVDDIEKRDDTHTENIDDSKETE